MTNIIAVKFLCPENFYIYFLLVDNFVLPGFFKCRNKRLYLDNGKICDKIVDCLDGSDEMFCDLVDVEISKCKQINDVMLDCNENMIDNGIENEKELDEESYRNLRSIEIKGNVNMNFLQSSLFLNVLKILNNQKYFSKLKSIVFTNLYYLILKNCSFNGTSTIFNSKLKILQYLDISLNPIFSLKFLNETESNNLKYLDISSTKIEHLSKFLLKNFVNLQTFLMKKNNLLNIQKDTFAKLFKLENVFLDETKIENEIENLYIKDLKEIIIFKSNYFKICCIFKINFQYKKNFQCLPTSSIFQSCTNLINTNIKQAFYWTFGLFGCFGNLILIIILFLSFKQSFVFLLQISVSDFLISSYILSIAITDVYYDKHYMENDVNWRRSTTCQILGIITTFAMILSVFSTFLLTLERYLIVVDPIKKNFLSEHQILFVISTILLSLFLSSIPFLTQRVSKL